MPDERQKSAEMKIKHRMQSLDSSLCGQACIAMLLDLEIDVVVSLMGRRGGTTIKMLSQFLSANGFECDDRLTRTSKGWGKPNLCIIKLRFNGRYSGHWVLWNGETKMYHDPSSSQPIEENIYEAWLPTTPENARITSYLEIKKQ